MEKDVTDKIGEIFIIAVILVFIMMVVGLTLTPKEVTPSVIREPRVGETWLFYKDGNPFNKDETYSRKIISIKNSFIQFIEDDNDTLSENIDNFIINSEFKE